MTVGDRIAVAALSVALVAVGLGGWLLFSAATSPGPVADEPIDPFGSAAASSTAPAAEMLVVDVEGAVLRPGIIQLPAGSRVADAVAAAGGYAPEADLVAAAAQVNLAAALRDGQQVVVPAIGAPAASIGPEGAGARGLVDLNSASPDALDALPGLGPVTVQKIVAARVEQAFRSLEELVTRKVLSNAQLDKIRDLVTIN